MSGNRDGEFKSPYSEVRPKTVERICLKCDKSFKSTGPGNRICGECGRDNVHAYRKDIVKEPFSSLSKGKPE